MFSDNDGNENNDSNNNGKYDNDADNDEMISENYGA